MALLFFGPPCTTQWVARTWRFFGDDRPGGGARRARPRLVHRPDAELVLLALLEVRHDHLRLPHRVDVHLLPVARPGGRLRLDDVAVQLAAARVARLVPVQRHRGGRDGVDHRLTGRTTQRCTPQPHQSDVKSPSRSNAYFYLRHFNIVYLLPSVLWDCWLGGRKGTRPVKILSGGVLAWLSVWSEVQTCIRPSWCHCHSRSVSCFSKIQIGFTFLVQADPGSPGKRAIKRVCVCVLHAAHTVDVVLSYTCSI